MLDAPFVRAGRPPLAIDLGGVKPRGFLRHRSALADLNRPGTTYRGLFEASLRSGMTVVDGGAHVGFYSLLATRAGARVVAFEPDPYNLRALERNLDGTGARIVAKALGDGPGQHAFYLSRSTIGSSFARRTRDDLETIVEVTSLDEEFRGVELDALLVRLNIEGAEPLALEGMHETLGRCSDVVMFVEINPGVLASPRKLVERLTDLSFDLWSIDLPNQALVPLEPSGPLAKGHLFASRTER
jgi:FkbM family methyltransferase